MKINICKFKFAFLMVLCLPFLFVGCATQRAYKPVVPPEPIDSRQPTNWQKDEGALYINAKTNFSIATDKIIEGMHKLAIKGTINSCYYSYIPFQSRKVPRQHYDKYQNMWIQSWKEESQTLSVERKNWMPGNIRISNPFGGTEIVDVSEDGTFEVFFEIPQNYFLKIPQPQNYRTPAKSTKQYTIKITGVNPLYGGNFVALDSMPTMWQYTLDTDKAKRFAKGNICEVNLRFQDANSRRSIMPKVVISVLEPSKDDVYSVMSEEFDGNEELIETAFNSVYGVILEGVKKTSITDYMSFNAWVGGKYKIEATHGKYYYFSTILEPNSNEKIKKEVLLIEKGSKVRLEKTNEGEVGSMIDSD